MIHRKITFTGTNIDDFIIATDYKLKISQCDNKLTICDLDGVKHFFCKGDIVDIDNLIKI